MGVRLHFLSCTPRNTPQLPILYIQSDSASTGVLDDGIGPWSSRGPINPHQWNQGSAFQIKTLIVTDNQIGEVIQIDQSQRDV